ncbi:MAG: nucleoside deaminase [Bacillota bacterium]
MDFQISLPDWVEDLLGRGPKVFPAAEDRVRLVMRLAQENIERRTGGPFGAGIFDASGRLIAPGINIVTPTNCSVLHAEMVAIALAHKRLGRYDLGDGGKFYYELVTSTEPCAMCFGAIPWSGVARLVCGARGEDAQRIGFDEGPKLPHWWKALEERGIQVTRDLLREDGVSILKRYIKLGGPIYYPRNRGSAK